jgi:hypothetical protein
MSIFVDKNNYNPEYHARPPLKRSFPYLFLRFLVLAICLLFSKHPSDLWLWSKSMFLNRLKPLSYPIPWLTFDVIRMLEKIIKPGMNVFEYGSGHSTLFFAGHRMNVYSVEHDKYWYDLMVKKIQYSGIDNVTIYHGDCQEKYVNAIETCGIKNFDIILLDGIHRLNCLYKGLPYLKSGGYLIFDDTDFNWFKDIEIDVPKNWAKKVYSGYEPLAGGRSETTIWRKS